MQCKEGFNVNINTYFSTKKNSVNSQNAHTNSKGCFVVEKFVLNMYMIVLKISDKQIQI